MRSEQRADQAQERKDYGWHKRKSSTSIIKNLRFDLAFEATRSQQYQRLRVFGKDSLRFYATRFATVEVDSSYYGLPSARNAQLWAERTPVDFSFVVKAFRLFTLHHTAPDALPKDIRAALGPTTKKNLYYADLPAELAIELWSRFRTALALLQRANKLAGVLFQFPPWCQVQRPRAAGPLQPWVRLGHFVDSVLDPFPFPLLSISDCGYAR